MIILDAKRTTLGRLASYAAKEALKGEEISILNCGDAIITGNFKFSKKNFEEKRGKVGTLQKGPKYPSTSEKIVKRTIRGMLPDPRGGRGREALKRIKCYSKIPKEYENSKTFRIQEKKKIKYSELKKFTRENSF